MEDLAEVAYNGYCQSSGGISLISGAKLPAFQDLPEDIRKAWRAAAVAVEYRLEGESENKQP